MKRLLMIAYHFPPLAGSSGIQRTLSFARHLHEFGWEPLILTAHPRAYERREQGPPRRSAARHRSSRARSRLTPPATFRSSAATPAFSRDRTAGSRGGRVRCRAAFLSSAATARERSGAPTRSPRRMPSATACSGVSGLPWVADFRDPMAQDGYPADPKTWKSFDRIEARTVRDASSCVFVTSGAARIYRERYPELPTARFSVIENGYDEEMFAPFQDRPRGARWSERVTLLHSGVVYPSERDPTQFFEALARMRDEGRCMPGALRVRLSRPGQRGIPFRAYRPLPHRGHRRAGAADSVSRGTARNDARRRTPRTAGRELQRSDPGEALRVPALPPSHHRADGSGRRHGSPAARAGLRHIAPLDSPTEIAAGLERFLDEIARGVPQRPGDAFVAAATRAERTRELAGVLDRIAA